MCSLDCNVIVKVYRHLERPNFEQRFNRFSAIVPVVLANRQNDGFYWNFARKDSYDVQKIIASVR